MDGRCETCMWWQDRKDHSPRMAPIPDGWKHCALAESAADKPYYDTMAYAVDYECYGGDLLTAPNFGCVQWEGSAE